MPSLVGHIIDNPMLNGSGPAARRRDPAGAALGRGGRRSSSPAAGSRGLSLALTLHQIGVPARVYEAASEIRPLGVGINLQPNAVRELFDLGLGAEVLDRVGLPAREWALVGLNGNDIHARAARGSEAGYRWPHTPFIAGRSNMALHEAVRDRLGEGAVVTGARAQGYAQDADGVTFATCLARMARTPRRAARS